MPQFWKKVKEVLQEGAEAVKEGAAMMAEKSQEAINIGKVKLQIHNLHRKTEKQFTELGGRIYDLIQEKVPQAYGDPLVKKLIEEVKGFQKEIEMAEKEIESLQRKELEKEKKPEARPRGKKEGAGTAARKQATIGEKKPGFAKSVGVRESGAFHKKRPQGDSSNSKTGKN